MKLIDKKTALSEIKKMAKGGFGDMVKAVVDVEKKIMAVDMELHADGEARLLKEGSKQADLWGINLYPEAPEQQQIEFRSMINVKPFSGNNSLVVDDQKIQNKIKNVVKTLIKE